jgi:hypothetical protein
MIFTDKQQKAHRATFIEECRQKAWGCACHANWISKGVEGLLVEYRRLQEEDKTLEADIKALEAALDSHTVDNRNKRKAIQERRNTLAHNMKVIAESSQEGQRVMSRLLESIESNLKLAEHAETWEWKEIEPTPIKS